MSSSINQSELRDAINKILADYGVDFYEGNLIHRTEQRLSLIRDFQNCFMALIEAECIKARIDEQRTYGQLTDEMQGDRILELSHRTKTPEQEASDE